MLGLSLARLGLLIRLLAPAGALTFFGATSALAEVGAVGPAPDTAQACPSKSEALAGVELPAEAGAAPPSSTRPPPAPPRPTPLTAAIRAPEPGRSVVTKPPHPDLLAQVGGEGAGKMVFWPIEP